MVLTTGGGSVGDYDMLRRALELLGAEILLWKVRIKPGSAFVAAVYRDALILCLSGNPSAAVISFFLLGIPALRVLEGRSDPELTRIRVRLARPFRKNSPNRRFLPGKLVVDDGFAYLEQAERQGNGMLHAVGRDSCRQSSFGSGQCSGRLAALFLKSNRNALSDDGALRFLLSDRAERDTIRKKTQEAGSWVPIF